MKRCQLCHRIIWPFPWVHIAFRYTHRGEVRWHRACYASIQRVFQEDADHWERISRQGGI